METFVRFCCCCCCCYAIGYKYLQIKIYFENIYTAPEYHPPAKKVIKEEPKKYVKAPPKVVEPIKEKEPTIFLEQYYYGVHNQEQANDSATPVNFKMKVNDKILQVFFLIYII